MRQFKRYLAKTLASLFVCTSAAVAFAQGGSIQLDAVLIESSDLMQSGDPQAALALLKRYEQDYSSQPEFLNNLAVAYLGNSQPTEALTILRQLVEADPVFSIVTHNLLELELQIAEAPPEKINPVLFVQSTKSFFESEIDNLYGDLPEQEGPQVQEPQSSEEVSITAVIDQGSSQAESPSPEIRLANSDTDAEIPLSVRSEASWAETEEILLDLTQTWAAAWSNKDITTYLNAYASDYQPNANTSNAEWRGNRDAALNRPGNISVELTNLLVSLEEDRAQVQFDQGYRSSNYSDRVRKTLVYSLTADGWKIVSETSINLD